MFFNRIWETCELYPFKSVALFIVILFFGYAIGRMGVFG